MQKIIAAALLLSAVAELLVSMNVNCAVMYPNSNHSSKHLEHSHMILILFSLPTSFSCTYKHCNVTSVTAYL